jgi:mono/diheme cytochrome c family protein
MTQQSPSPSQEYPNAIFPILFLLGVVFLFVLIGTPRPSQEVLDARIAAANPTSTPVPVVIAEPTIQPTPEDHLLLMAMGLEQVNASDVARGQMTFSSTCASCHGFDARGVMGLGKTLIDSEFVNGLNDADLVSFIIVGRATNDPLNTTGMQMPGKGGNSSLSDNDIRGLVAYIRSLNGATVVEDRFEETTASTTTDTTTTDTSSQPFTPIDPNAFGGATQPEEAVVIEIREFVPLDINALPSNLAPASFSGEERASAGEFSSEVPPNADFTAPLDINALPDGIIPASYTGEAREATGDFSGEIPPNADFTVPLDINALPDGIVPPSYVPGQ